MKSIRSCVSDLANLVSKKRITSTDAILEEFGIKSFESNGNINAMANTLWAALEIINDQKEQIENMENNTVCLK